MGLFILILGILIVPGIIVWYSFYNPNAYMFTRYPGQLLGVRIVFVLGLIFMIYLFAFVINK